MKCIQCGEEINEIKDKYKLLTIDGDFIHIACEKDWNKDIDRINNMTDKEFESYMTGGILS